MSIEDMLYEIGTQVAELRLRAARPAVTLVPPTPVEGKESPENEKKCARCKDRDMACVKVFEHVLCSICAHDLRQVLVPFVAKGRAPSVVVDRGKHGARWKQVVKLVSADGQVTSDTLATLSGLHKHDASRYLCQQVAAEKLVRLEPGVFTLPGLEQKTG